MGTIPDFLESNLGLAYPFADLVTAPLIDVVADALVISNQPGPYVVTIFDPQFPLVTANFRLQIQGPNGVFLDTTGCTATDLGGFTWLSMVDPTTGAQARFIVDTVGLPGLTALLTPAELVPAVCQILPQQLTSLQGLQGDVVLSLPNYCTATPASNGPVTLNFQDPAARVVCGAAEPAVFGFGGGTADPQGSMNVEASGCYRLVPVAGSPGMLDLVNFCSPCVSCDDINTLQNKLISQSDYFYQLSTIYVNQFDRYQKCVAAANGKIAAVGAAADIVVPSGFINFVGRVFNRPYFNQVYVAVVNNTLNSISVSMTMSIVDPAVGSQLAVVPSSVVCTKTLSGGTPFGGFAGFPGTITFGMDPQDSVGFNTELQRMTVTPAAPVTSSWQLSATVTFTGGPAPLPGPITITKLLLPAISLFGAPLTTVTP